MFENFQNGNVNFVRNDFMHLKGAYYLRDRGNDPFLKKEFVVGVAVARENANLSKFRIPLVCASKNCTCIIFKNYSLTEKLRRRRSTSEKLRKISFSPVTRGLFAKLAFLQHFKTIATQKIPT